MRRHNRPPVPPAYPLPAAPGTYRVAYPADDPAYQPPFTPSEPPLVIRLPGRRRGLSPAGWSLALLAAGLAGLLALLGGMLVLFYAYFQASNRILPGVSVGDLPLGGSTLAEAEQRLAQSMEYQVKIQVTNGLQSQSLAPAELGLRIDPAGTAARAHAVGHGGAFLVELSQTFNAAWSGWPVEPAVALDEAAARARLEALAPQMSQPAKNATLRVQGTEFIPIPGELGYTINIDATLDFLRRNAALVLLGGQLPVIPQPVPPQVTDVTGAIAEARRLLDTPLQIQAYDPIADQSLSWPVPREAIAAWLVVEPGEAGPRVGLDEAQAAAYLDSLAASLGPGRTIDSARHAGPLVAALRQGQAYTATVSYQPTTYTVQDGDTMLKIGWKLGMPYWLIVKANPGMDPEAIHTGQQLTIPAKDVLLPLPVVPGKRIIISISQQRLWVYENGQLLGEHIISTGIDRSPTQPGVFQVQTHDPSAYASVWDLTMPHFLGIYEAWPGFMNGIHGLPTLSNGQRLWANILGKPASYGCIILDLPTAKWLYNWAENGVVVEIKE